jgi:hypothetical protein
LGQAREERQQGRAAAGFVGLGAALVHRGDQFAAVPQCPDTEGIRVLNGGVQVAGGAEQQVGLPFLLW